MKKYLISLFGVSIATLLFLVGCFSNNGCVGDGKYYYDNEYHWQNCKDPNCVNKVGYEEHKFDKNVCSVCGYVGLNGVEYRYIGEAYELAKYDGNQADIVLVDSYDDNIHGKYPITSIGEGVFSYSNITSITIPETIATIKNQAFANCTLLSNINFSNNLKTIGDEVFYGNSNLKSITIPDSVTSIGKKTFENCHNLETIELSNKLKTISENLFYCCYKINNLNIPSGVESIKDNAFCGCSLLNNITLPSSLNEIGKNAFSYCESLTSFELPNNIKKINERTFYKSYNLKTIKLPENITSIGIDSFSESISDIYYAGSIDKWTQIDGLEYLMYNDDNHQINLYCDNLNVAISEIDLTSSSIKEIKPYAFNSLNNIKTIKLPSKLEKIGKNAFKQLNTESIQIYFDGSIDKWVQIKGNEYLCGTYDSVNLSFKDINILENLDISSTIIENYAFANCLNLKSVTLSDNLKYVGDKAFLSCINLSFKEYDNAYYLGNSLKNLVLVKVKDKEITECQIADDCIAILYKAFNDCNITDINLSNKIVCIGENAFSYCNNLETVIIAGNKDLIINTYAFYSCTNLINLVLLNAKEVASYAFFSGNNYKLNRLYVNSFNDFNKIDIDLTKNGNLKIYYYSESDPGSTGNYWHYDNNFKPIAW